MSKIGDLLISLQEELELDMLTPEEIAAKYDVPISWVYDASKELIDRLMADEGIE